jgi:hypothetical protein
MDIYTENDGMIKTKRNQGVLLKWGHCNKRKGILIKGEVAKEVSMKVRRFVNRSRKAEKLLQKFNRITKIWMTILQGLCLFLPRFQLLRHPSDRLKKLLSHHE